MIEGRLRSTTLKRVHATLNKAPNDAVKRNLLVVNPAAHIELPTAQAKGFDIWTPSQLAASCTRRGRTGTGRSTWSALG